MAAYVHPKTRNGWKTRYVLTLRILWELSSAIQASNRPLVTRVVRDLKNSGVEVWLDEWEIKVGDEIRQKIEHGISEYEFFLIFLSEHSVASTWVEKELNAAFMKEVKSNFFNLN